MKKIVITMTMRALDHAMAEHCFSSLLDGADPFQRLPENQRGGFVRWCAQGRGLICALNSYDI